MSGEKLTIGKGGLVTHIETGDQIVDARTMTTVHHQTINYRLCQRILDITIYFQ